MYIYNILHMEVYIINFTMSNNAIYKIVNICTWYATHLNILLLKDYIIYIQLIYM